MFIPGLESVVKDVHLVKEYNCLQGLIALVSMMRGLLKFPTIIIILMFTHFNQIISPGAYQDGGILP